jgi:regulator of protease activity HflC (stomatin/prohibitin superfamily)
MTRAGAWVERWIDRHFVGATISGMVAAFFVLFFFHNIFITIPAGHGGALWLRFFGGTVDDFHYGEGTKMIFPWDKIYIYDMRVQQESAMFDVLSKEGLQMSVDVTLRFRLNPSALGRITRHAGPDFVKIMVMPTIGAILRLESSQFTAEEIYSTSRNVIETQIRARALKVIDDLIAGEVDDQPEVIVQDFWLRSIRLPENLMASIEAKLTQRQLAEQYTYIIQREEQERARKIIEAQGIKAFQDTVSSGITDSYLRWRGIDATLKLADSPNAKIVVIGGKEGLPLILGPWESAPAPGAAPRAVDLSTAPSSQVEGTTARTPSSMVDTHLKVPNMPTEPLALDPKASMPPTSPNTTVIKK